MKKNGRPTLYSDADVETIVRMCIEGFLNADIAEAIGREVGPVSSKVSSLRKCGAIPAESNRSPRPWTPEAESAFIQAWNAEGADITAIMERFGRTPCSVRQKASSLRSSGIFMRNHALPIDAQPGAPDFNQFATATPFEDDPAAIGPGRPVYMPVITPQYSSASSSLYGGRYISTSGKSGAVV